MYQILYTDLKDQTDLAIFKPHHVVLDDIKSFGRPQRRTAPGPGPKAVQVE